MSSFKTATKEDAGKSGLIFVKTSNDQIAQKIITTTDLQIGLAYDPAGLKITGDISINSSNVSIISGKDYVCPDTSTLINVTSVGSPDAVNVFLPVSPKTGQIVIIKDAAGTASVTNINIKGSSSTTIDGLSSKTILSNYGSMQLIYDGSSWSAISVNGSAAPIDSQYVVLSANASLTNERVLTAGSGISIVDGGAGSTVTISATGGSSGDVVGPASSTDNAVVRFDLTTGKLIQNSGVIIDDSNNVTTPGDIAINGGDLTSTATTFNLLNSNVTTINVGGAATAVNVGASTADVVIGRAEIGAWPAGTSYAFFGNSDYDHSIAGNYALIQASSAGTKNTWLNAPTGGKIYFANNDSALGYIDDNEIYLVGKSGVSQTTTLGSTSGSSSLTLNAGTGGINLNSSGSISLNTVNNAFINFTSNGIDALGSIGYSTFFGGFSTINLTGISSDDTFLTLGNSYGGSAASIYAGTGGVTLSGSATTTITGSSSGKADVYIGSAEIGTHPYYGRNYALFGHKDLDHSVGTNYALVQGSDGTTYINSPTNKSISFRSNATELAYFYYNSLFSSTEISLQGVPSFNNTVAIGSSWGGSSTSLYGGTGGILLSGSGATTTITGSAPGNADAYIGSAEIGVHPYWGRNYAMFGHKDLSHSVAGNYGLVQKYDGTTWLNAAAAKKLYLANNDSALGYLDDNEISLTGKASTIQTVTLGSTYSSSKLTLNAGTGNIDIGTSDSARTINIGPDPVGTATSTQTINIGAKNTAVGGFNAVNIADGDSAAGHAVNIISSNGTQSGGTSVIQIGTVQADCTVTVGNDAGYSLTTINGGTGGIQIGSSNTGGVTITASTTSNADALIGAAEVGTHPNLGSNYAMFGHKDYSHTSNGNYALLAVGPAGLKNTWLNAPTGGRVYFANNDSALGYLDDNEISLTGKASTTQAVTLGSTYGSSSLTLNAGTGNIGIETYNGLSTISIGTVNQPRTIEIGTASTQAQTINIATGGAVNDINIGNYVAGTNTTVSGDGVQVYSNGGTIAIDSSGTGGTVNIDTFGYNSSVNVGTGAAVKTVIVGSTTSTSTTTIQGGSSGVSVNSSNGNIILNPTAVNGTIYLRNNGSDLATFSYNNVLGNTFSNIYLTGKSGDDTFVNIGSSYGSSNVNIYGGAGGSGGVSIDGGIVKFLSNAKELGFLQSLNVLGTDYSYITLTGSTGTSTQTRIGNTYDVSSLTLDAGSGSIKIGTSDSSRTISIGTASSAKQEITIGNDVAGTTTTILAGGSGFGPGIGNVYLSGAIGTSYYIGGEGGTGNIVVGQSVDNNTINIGTSGNDTSKTQTIQIGSGTGKSVVTVGNSSGASSLSLNAGTGNISLSSTGQIDFSLDGYSMGYFNRDYNAIGSYYYDEIFLTGRNNVLVTEPTYVTIGSTRYNSTTDIKAGTGGVTITGVVTNSTQPGFLATLSSTQTNIATTTDVTVTFNSAIFDNASNFDTGTYTFTAPVTGKYLFNVAVRINQIDTAAEYYSLYLITSNRTYRLAVIDPGQFVADVDIWYLNGSAIADMDANDTAYVVIRQQLGTSQTDIASAIGNSFFSGYMLG